MRKPAKPKPALSHLDEGGQVRMVDVSAKAVTTRRAVAEGFISVSKEAWQLVARDRVPKGSVGAAARIAATLAAKQTAGLIPLCHPLPLTGIEIEVETPKRHGPIRVQATVACDAKTGAEMEALCAVSIGLLTIYDMLKAADPAMVIHGIRLLAKTGGKKDFNAPL